MVQQLNTYHVIQDDEGFWITETPNTKDTIIYSTTELFTAERVLCRYVSASD